MKSLLNNNRPSPLPYPVYITKRVGNTKFDRKILYCPGTYAINVRPMSPKDFGLIRANAKMHKRTNHR